MATRMKRGEAEVRKLTLMDKRTGEPLRVGQKVTTFRGETGVLEGWTEPRHPEDNLSIGARVQVKLDGDSHTSYWFPGVINAKFVWR